MKTNLDKYFKSNEDLEKNGVWFDLTEEVGFLVRPFKATNPQIKAAVANHYKPYARQLEMGTLSEDKVLEINIKVFVAACLVDWRGVEIDGVPTAYSPDVAAKFLKSLPDLFTTLHEHCSNFKNYRDEVGNS